MTSGDFSWLALFLAGLVTVAQAYTQPKGDPSGNSILTPGLNQAVPVGKPFDITWVPTTAGTVTLLLLHGESTNMIPMYPIVEKLPNIGKFTWTPKSDIAPEKTHYGIQLICDDNGQYQWSTQFGISNPSYSGSQSSSTASSVSIHVSASTSETVSTSSTSLSTSARPTLTASTGFPMHNSSIIHPSGTISTSKTIKTTTTAKHTTISTTPLSTSQSTTSSSPTSEVSTASEAMAAMYTAAGGVVAFAAAAVLAL